MNRRRVLAAIGTGSALALAGCLGEADGNAPDGNTSDGNTSDNGTPDNGTADGAQPTSEPPVIEGQPCPPVATDRDGAVCSHTVDPAAAAVSLTATPESSTLADGRPTPAVTLTLHNESTSDLTFNPQRWTIAQQTDTGWEPLEAEWVGDGRLTVSADETHSWTFLEAVEAVRPDPELPAGLYAAEIGVPDPEIDGDWLACIALVRLSSGG